MTSSRITTMANDKAAKEHRQGHKHQLHNGAGKAREVAFPMKHKAPAEPAEHPPQMCPCTRPSLPPASGRERTRGSHGAAKHDSTPACESKTLSQNG